MIFIPAEDYRYAFRKGDEGTDVGILQCNLPGKIAVDGRFGDETEAAVIDWQEKHRGLVVDGIAGTATTESMVTQYQRGPTRRHDLPKGMLKSIAFNESSFQIANAAQHAGDEGWDAGVFARSSGDGYGSDAFYAAAFDIKKSAEWTAVNLVTKREAFPKPVDSRYLTELATDNREKFLWQLAILSHNWPGSPQSIQGAYGIAVRGSATSPPGRDDQPAAWIEQATLNPKTGISLLHTPRQWVMSYVLKASHFVQWK